MARPRAVCVMVYIHGLHTWFTRENKANSLPKNEVNLCDREI